MSESKFPMGDRICKLGDELLQQIEERANGEELPVPFSLSVLTYIGGRILGTALASTQSDPMAMLPGAVAMTVEQIGRNAADEIGMLVARRQN